jgi:hypothetical protein
MGTVRINEISPSAVPKTQYCEYFILVLSVDLYNWFGLYTTTDIKYPLACAAFSDE